MEPTRKLEVGSTAPNSAKTEVMPANHGKNPSAESKPGPRSSKSRVKDANNPKARDVEFESRNSVEEIRAVLASKSPKRKSLSAGAWIALALALAIPSAAFSAWQWTASKERAAENIALPQIATPKPPEFALDPSSHAASTGAGAGAGSSAAQSTLNSVAPGSGN